MRSIAFAFLLILTSSCRTQLSIKKATNDKNLTINQGDLQKGDTILTEYIKITNWVSQMQGSNGLLKSSEVVDFVSLYDNALAAIWFTSQGKIKNTERILDYFESKIELELLNNQGGFYQLRDSKGNNGRRTWMGDNAWLLIAINYYHQISGNRKYDYMADQLELWLLSLQDIDGGLWGGFNEDGRQIPKVTEGIITAFNAVRGYSDFHKNILAYIKKERWLKNEQILVAWPENPKYLNALDLHSLGFMIFKNFPETTLNKADMYLNTQVLTTNNKPITGYSFDEDKDVIWLEGTAQMAVAFQMGGYESDADTLLTELEKTFIDSTTLSESKGIPYSSNQGTNFGNNPLWEHADSTPALSSTIWYLFAKSNFNPLELGRNKNIPEEGKFW